MNLRKQTVHNLRSLFFVTIASITAVFLLSCGKKSSDSSYSFSAASSTKLSGAGLASSAYLNPDAVRNSLEELFSEDYFDSQTFVRDRRLAAASTATSCNSYFCVTPTALVGKYFAVGLLLQASGSGMAAYFGKETAWSEIKGTSDTYDFDFAAPITNSGTFTCCGGTGNLSAGRTIISDTSFLFGYLDATFEITATSGAHGTAVGVHTVRFVLADDVITSGKRGDLLYKDTDLVFKWVDSETGVMSTTRPTSPVVMNTSVVNYTNPWGNVGAQSIPVIYAGLTNATGGVMEVTEAELKTVGRTYSFSFNAANLVLFPGIIADQDEGYLASIKDVLAKIHLQGLPTTAATLGKAPDTVLTVTGP